MQNAKQMNSGLKHVLEAGIEDFRLPEVRSSPRLNPPHPAGVPSVYTTPVGHLTASTFSLHVFCVSLTPVTCQSLSLCGVAV